MKYKVAYRGDGTKETGKKIIAELEKLGGINRWDYKGTGDYYYVISEIPSNIERLITLPKTRTLITLESTQKLFRLL